MIDIFEVFGVVGLISLLIFFFLLLMNNYGCYIVLLGNVCCWLGEQVEVMGVEVYLGFFVVDVVEEDGVIKGVVMGDFGVVCDGGQKDGYQLGMEFCGKYMLIVEGVCGLFVK